MWTQKELTDALDLASRQYYNGLKTQFSDTEFDLLLKELQKMEMESGVVYPNSPTTRVGSDLQEGFKKGRHPKSMLTIENVYTDEDLAAWIKSMNEKHGTFIYSVGVKYDGVSCELHYINGVLETALTRGDKIIGDDITENVKTIKSVPLVIKENVGERFYVRGEILLPKSRLAAINDERINRGEKPFANTRNACSGTIKSFDPKEVARRGLIFRAWDCFGDEIDVMTMSEKFDILEDCGFYYERGTKPEQFVVNTIENFTANINNHKTYIDELNLDYDYDGLVLKISDVKTQDIIGIKDTRAVEWAIARKWNEEYIVKTKLVGVDWQVGRTGVLTPVGRLEPVECGGVVISNVTLNNMDFINSLGICIGDTLEITRSGGVIPYVLGAEHNADANVAIIAPQMCPECGELIIKDGALLKCTNPDCPSIVKGKLLQFCSKDCMDIRSIGESVVNDLYDKGLVRNVSDFYTLKDKGVNELVTALGAGYGEKKVKKMLDEIEKSKKQPWERVLAGLSVPGVGKVMARTLAKKYSAMLLAGVVKEYELSSIDGIGPIMAHDIYEWWHKEENVKMYLDLVRAGLNTNAKGEHAYVTLDEDMEKKLDGLTVCFTGSSYRMKGDAVEEFLEKNGAKCVHGVNKKLNYLITGDKPGGSKVAKAEELGVEIINERDFYNKFGI